MLIRFYTACSCNFVADVFRVGLILMVLGEIGNFSAYGFSPASLVAPLGTTTVIGMLLDYLSLQSFFFYLIYNMLTLAWLRDIV